MQKPYHLTRRNGIPPQRISAQRRAHAGPDWVANTLRMAQCPQR
jgi:hypothetical protein